MTFDQRAVCQHRARFCGKTQQRVWQWFTDAATIRHPDGGILV
jgi:hypothetical protein